MLELGKNPECPFALNARDTTILVSLSVNCGTTIKPVILKGSRLTQTGFAVWFELCSHILRTRLSWRDLSGHYTVALQSG
jgi:hypothetical protein